jgi:ribosomal-protein-alanine N-acetyltransferase
MKPVFRKASTADAELLYPLEQASHSHPWSLEQLSDLLGSASTHCEILELEQTGGNELVGFYFAQGAADEVTLLNIVVDPARTGQGWGRMMMNRLLNALEEEGICQALFLEVRVSNFRAISLYMSMGFVEVASRRDYYPLEGGGREDALVMALPVMTNHQ